jgi:predicted transcriptional regulator
VQISHTIAADMLEKVDALAKRTGQSRAAMINLALFRLVAGGV